VNEAKTSVIDRNEQQVSAMKLQHGKESKGLIVQIRYLKAKFTRESLFRCDLGYQKQYLLVLLGQFEKRCVNSSIMGFVDVLTCDAFSEQRILAAIATIGYPAAPPLLRSGRKKRTFKSVVASVVFIARTKSVSEPYYLMTHN